MRKVKLGLIGVGAIGQIHLQSCLHLEKAEIVSVADPSRKSLRYAKSKGVPILHVDYDKLLRDDSVEAVIICVPNFLHSEIASRAAEAGKDIFLEKPLATNIKDGKKILSSAQRYKIKLMIDYPTRFIEALIKIKEELQTGALGDIQLASATNVSGGPFYIRGELGLPAPVPSWWFNHKLAGGGALLDLGIHEVNLLRWYFGKVVDTRCYLGYRFNLDLEDHAICFLNFDGGPLTTVTVGWFSKDFRKSFELYGTVKHASIVASARSRSDFLLDIVKRKLGKTESFQKPYLEALRHFVDCIIYDIPPSPSGEEALLDLETILKAYKNSTKIRGDIL